MKIPLVTECKNGHCELHFPQFEYLDEKEYFIRLNRCISEGLDEKSYFSQTYKNKDKQLEIFKDAVKLPFIESCEFVYKKMNEIKKLEEFIYFDCDFYKTKNSGRIVKFIPCCR